MAGIAEYRHEDICDLIVDALKQSGRYADGHDVFTRLLFDGLLPHDAENLDPRVMANMVVVALEQYSARHPGDHIVKIHEGRTIGVEGAAFIQVVDDNRPFLVDSLIGELRERNISVSLVLHPIVTVLRDGDGRLVQILDEGSQKPEGAITESLIVIQIDAQPDPDDYALLRASLSEILDSVETVVADWKPMLAQLDEITCALSNLPEGTDVQELDEALAFLNWLKEDNFVFLGTRELKLVGDIGDEHADLRPVPDSGLGILRNENVRVLRKGYQQVHFTQEIRKFFFQPMPLIVTKANTKSKIHRHVHMDYVGVKIFGDAGKVIGELRIVGLFTSQAIAKPNQATPLIRRKIEYVMDRSGYDPGGHAIRGLTNVLETYPWSELFQIDPDLLAEFAAEIQDLALRAGIKVFSRVDEFNRFVSVLVFVPRNRFSTDIRLQIGDYLAQAYDGRVSAYYPAFLENELVRLHFIIGRYAGETPVIERDELEQTVLEITRGWEDRLNERLVARLGSGDGDRLARKYRAAFSKGLQDLLSTESAVEAIQHIERLSSANPLAIRFYEENENGEPNVRVELFHADGPLRLSERVPTFENLGFNVISEWSDEVGVTASGAGRVHIHDMMLVPTDGQKIELRNAQDNLIDGLLAVWQSKSANDSYNRLILAAQADWREAALMRAFGAYMTQISLPFDQSYLSNTLVAYPAITRQLLDLFELRFDPKQDMAMEERSARQKSLLADIEESLGDVPSLDEDRIFRHFTNLITAAQRTNFYQSDEEGGRRPAIAFKFRSDLVEGLPRPVPFAEIFVYSPRVEGIHLRGGPVARGGLRWSDRRQDFRTEVLGLAKAQQVKNTVIVPKGSKGGFVPQNLPSGGDREAILNEGVACYKIFISSLLSVTDNIRDGIVVPPEQTVRHDGDDPYLVVAADKGTAAFSDYANGVSQEHGFWLDDAFASGGSAGYDHKKMGITARGAWEAVKRHFREMDTDIQSETIRVIGVGDMSGDVFGNGMLLSKTLKVIAAFDHRDIFIDPDPDPATSWQERNRLFDLGRSSWQDYNAELISRGGGVFSRSAKSIPLSDEVKALTGLQSATATPNALIRALLGAQADLLWFGGIGTYVRGPHETDEMVGDRANDALRIGADTLKVKVVGEGANLGMTQAARVAFALGGGRVNTDAIDNSAGVNSSDLEVNIKIALGTVVAAGGETLETRNVLLQQMTDEVAERCLRNNYLQSLAISLDERRGRAELDLHQRFMRSLEADGLLDRSVEGLPSDAELEERGSKGDGLTRPEIAVLLGYAKLALADALVESELVADPFFESDLYAYFPPTLVARHRDAIRSHRLRKEIIATVLTNAALNRGGAGMVFRLKEVSGHDEAQIVRAFVAASAVYDLEPLYELIDGTDNKLSGQMQLDLYAKVQALVWQQTGWFVRNADWSVGLGELIQTYKRGVSAFSANARDVLPDHVNEVVEQTCADYADLGVPLALARRMSLIDLVGHGSDIVSVSLVTLAPLTDIARAYFDLRHELHLDRLEAKVAEMPVGDHYDRLATSGTVAGISDVLRSLAMDAAGYGSGLDAWREDRAEDLSRASRAIDDILESGHLSVAKLAIAAASLRDLIVEQL